MTDDTSNLPNPPCPECGTTSLAIAYGHRAQKGREAAKRERDRVSGCVVGLPNEPHWACPKCKERWRDHPFVILQPRQGCRRVLAPPGRAPCPLCFPAGGLSLACSSAPRSLDPPDQAPDCPRGSGRLLGAFLPLLKRPSVPLERPSARHHKCDPCSDKAKPYQCNTRQRGASQRVRPTLESRRISSG